MKLKWSSFHAAHFLTMESAAIKLWLLKRKTFWHFWTERQSGLLMNKTENLREQYFELLFNETTTWDALNMLSIISGDLDQGGRGFDLEKISIFRTQLGVNFGLLRRILDTDICADSEYKQTVLDQFVERVANIFGVFLLLECFFASKWVPKESCAKRAAKHNKDSLVKRVFKAVVENFFNGSRQGFRLHVTDLNTKFGLFEQAIASKFGPRWRRVQISIGAAKRNYKTCNYKFAHKRQWSNSDQTTKSMVRYKTLREPYWIPKSVQDTIYTVRKKASCYTARPHGMKPFPYIRDCDRNRLSSKPVVMVMHGDTFGKFIHRMLHFLLSLKTRCFIMRTSDGMMRNVERFTSASNHQFTRQLWRSFAGYNFSKKPSVRIPLTESAVVMYTSDVIERYKSPKHQYVNYGDPIFTSCAVLPHAILHYGRYNITHEELVRFKLRRTRQAIGHIRQRVQLWLAN